MESFVHAVDLDDVFRVAGGAPVKPEFVFYVKSEFASEFESGVHAVDVHDVFRVAGGAPGAHCLLRLQLHEPGYHSQFKNNYLAEM